MRHILLCMLLAGCNTVPANHWKVQGTRPHPFTDLVEIERLNQIAIEENDRKEKENYLLEHKLRPKFLEAFEKDTICIGMSKDLVGFIMRRVFFHYNRTVRENSIREQWVAESGSIKYLYFENGILTSWQD